MQKRIKRSNIFFSSQNNLDFGVSSDYEKYINLLNPSKQKSKIIKIQIPHLIRNKF